MIVTIDGPAGAGKSTVARSLALLLGFRFLDTGAMYRAVAWAALRRGIDLHDAAALAMLSQQLNIELVGQRVQVDGEDVTDEIRRADVTSIVHYVADQPRVRQHLVQLQRRVASQSDVVTEGRDQGTVVFPDADLKIYLTASPRERATRRMREMQLRGESSPLEDVLSQQNERDARDRARPVGKLMRAADAVEVSTDGLSLEQVVQQLVSLVQQRLPR